MPRPVILLGATGLTGRHAAAFLAADSRCSRLFAPTRRPLNLQSPKLEPLPLDPAAPSLPSAPGAVFLSCLGSTIKNAGSRTNFRRIDFEIPLAYARAALAAGARHAVLVSSAAASPATPNFYLRVKAELEEALSRLPFASLDIFRPSLILGDRPDRRLAERIASPIAQALAPLLLGPLSIYRPVHGATLAQALVHTSLSESIAPGRRLHHWREITRIPSTPVR